MTWCASQVFIKPNKEVMTYIQSMEKLRKSSYLFNMSDLDRCTARSRKQKLLIIKDICDKEKHPKRYEEVDFGEGALDYKDFPADYKVATIGLDQVKKDRGTLPFEEALDTPQAFLAYLKGISRQYHTTVCYFKVFMSGGWYDYAVAWVFEPVDKEDRLYLYEDFEIEGTCVAYNQVKQVSNHKGEPVLDAALKHFGITLDQGYFQPHTGHFDWERFRV